MSEVFVSYASEDRTRIESLIETFEGRGWSVWWDRQLVAGPRFEAHIASALASAKCVVVAWSKHSLDSSWCRDEAQEGLDRDILVPLRIDDVRPPLGFRSSHTASLIDWPREQGELESLLRGIEACLRGTRHVPRSDDGDAPTPATVRKSHKAARLGAIATVLLVVTALATWQLRRELFQSSIATTSIVVLPFKDLSPHGGQTWLGNGMAEALSFYLALVEPIVVKQPPPGWRTADLVSLGRQVRAGSAVTGSIQRAGDQLHVFARLIDLSDGTQLWSASYDRQLRDVFEVQRLVARAIVEAVEVELHLEVPANAALTIREARYGTSDVRAYEAYRKSLDIKFGRAPEPATVAELEKALKFNLEAVEIDPNYAQGFFGLATTYGALARRSGSPGYRRDESRALDRALALDPLNPMIVGRHAFTALGNSDWRRIISLVERLESWTDIAEVSAATYLIALVNVGRWNDAKVALDQLRRVVRRVPERFPPYHFVHAEIGFVMAILRYDAEDLVEYLEPRYGAGKPLQGGPMGRFLSDAYLARGLENEAQQNFVLSLPEELRTVASSTYAAAGRHEMLRVVLQHDAESGNACRIGNKRLYAEVGDLAQLLDCAKRPVDARLDFLWTLPVFDRYRDDPRFQAALADRNIVGYDNCCPPKQ